MKNANPSRQLRTNPRISAILATWHAPCKAPGIGTDGPPRHAQQGVSTMTTTFEIAQRIVFSSVAALVFAAVAVCAATPVVPIA
ncbi:hypothetical protein GCM10011380_31030 [Sphingomonas metalli]|uniref:Uncharacterized protein n=1 Tax=Sphingomonas metalli TaxID=1779358 RepID=A0A916TBX4_9SPHN|nr:hypothetical protein GCM10011380_31030 [Sphingomonas metalli]